MSSPDPSGPTETEALEQQKLYHASKRNQVFGSDPRVWAESRQGSGEYWHLYRQDHGYKRPKRVRIGELVTRNKNAIRRVLDALAPFAEGDTL